MSKIKKAFIHSLSGRVGVAAIGFLSSAVVARIETPSQIGVFATAMAVVGLVQILKEFGAGVYLIRLDVVTKDDVKAVITLTMMISLAFLACVLLSAEWLERYFSSPGLAPVLMISSLPLLLSPLTAPVAAIFTRELKQGTTALISLANVAVAGAVTVFVSWFYDLGALGLAMGLVAGSLASTMFSLAVRPSAHEIGFSLKRVRNVAAVGLTISASNIVGYLGSKIAEFVTAKALGPFAIAQISKADSAVQLMRRDVSGALASVLMPSLSEQLRTNNEKAAYDLLGTAFGVMSVVLWPCYLGFYYCADEIILLLFGDQWSEAGMSLRILAAVGIFSVVTDLLPSVFVATHLERRLLVGQITILLVRVGLLIALVPYGLSGVCWAIVLSGLLQVPLYSALAYRTSGFMFVRALPKLFKSALTLIFIASAVEGAIYVQSAFGYQLPDMLIYILVAPVVWVCSIYVLRHSIVEILTEFIKGGAFSGRH